MTDAPRNATFPIDTTDAAIRKAISEANSALGRAQWYIAGSLHNGDDDSKNAKLSILLAIDILAEVAGTRDNG